MRPKQFVQAYRWGRHCDKIAMFAAGGRLAQALGMLRVLAFAFVGFAVSSGQADTLQGLSREDALAIVVSSAKAHGYDLKNYKRSTFPFELSKDGKEWTFYYLCTPPPVRPGCDLVVTLQRNTGAVRFSKGE